MPKIRPGMRKPPKGFDLITDQLDAFEEKMKDAVNSVGSKEMKKTQLTWDIARVNYDRTRYVYDACYQQKKIPKEVVEYCASSGFIDGALVKKWKLSGYETLCCTQCVTSSNSCICRVPMAQRRRGGAVGGCSVCGCVGCASGDAKLREAIRIQKVEREAPEQEEGEDREQEDEEPR